MSTGQQEREEERKGEKSETYSNHCFRGDALDGTGRSLHSWQGTAVLLPGLTGRRTTMNPLQCQPHTFDETHTGSLAMATLDEIACSRIIVELEVAC